MDSKKAKSMQAVYKLMLRDSVAPKHLKKRADERVANKVFYDKSHIWACDGFMIVRVRDHSMPGAYAGKPDHSLVHMDESGRFSLEEIEGGSRYVPSFNRLFSDFESRDWVEPGLQAFDHTELKRAAELFEKAGLFPSLDERQGFLKMGAEGIDVIMDVLIVARTRK